MPQIVRRSDNKVVAWVPDQDLAEELVVAQKVMKRARDGFNNSFLAVLKKSNAELLELYGPDTEQPSGPTDYFIVSDPVPPFRLSPRS